MIEASRIRRGEFLRMTYIQSPINKAIGIEVPIVKMPQELPGISNLAGFSMATSPPGGAASKWSWSAWLVQCRFCANDRGNSLFTEFFEPSSKITVADIR